MNPQLPTTEQRNPRTTHLDTMASHDVVQTLLTEDLAAVAAALAVVGPVSAVVEVAAERVARGGRVHYFGAGASGRIAMLDATEITPTFGAAPDTFCAHFPGGTAALIDSTTDLEDAEELGRHDAAGALRPEDVAIGITASGTTPYVAGALRQARRVGVPTVVVTMSPHAPLLGDADLVVIADTGPEALTGSTRLKAGTATKVLLNAMSTAIMIKCGATYSNLMVGLTATNDKLRERSLRILGTATGESDTACRAALAEADGNVRLALVQLLAGASNDAARQALRRHARVSDAVSALVRDEP